MWYGHAFWFTPLIVCKESGMVAKKALVQCDPPHPCTFSAQNSFHVCPTPKHDAASDLFVIWFMLMLLLLLLDKVCCNLFFVFISLSSHLCEHNSPCHSHEEGHVHLNKDLIRMHDVPQSKVVTEWPQEELAKGSSPYRIVRGFQKKLKVKGQKSTRKVKSRFGQFFFHLDTHSN